MRGSVDYRLSFNITPVYDTEEDRKQVLKELP